MKNRILLATILSAVACVDVAQQNRMITIPDAPPSRGTISRGISANSKFSADLDLLIQQITVTRGERPPARLSPAQLLSSFGIKPGSSNPFIPVAVIIDSSNKADIFDIQGVEVVEQTGVIVQANVQLSALALLARDQRVLRIEPIRRAETGVSHIRRITPADIQSAPPLDRRGFTGKGVAVGVIDSGIDWRHPDFINADGTTRILALYDITDNSFAKTKGKVGTKPPKIEQGVPLGTVYTREQINAALKGTGTVNSTDTLGHGTAVASTAAGNGRGAGAKADAFKGVAPEADLIIVRAGDGHGLDPRCAMFAGWIRQVAADHHEPVAINFSAGSQGGTHDGHGLQEKALDEMFGAGKPGLVISVSAGNSGEDLIHASGKILPKPANQPASGRLLDLIVGRGQGASAVFGVFNAHDDWGLSIIGTVGSFLWVNGKSVMIQIRPKATQNLDVRFSPADALSDQDKKLIEQKLIALRVDGDTASLSVLLPEDEGSGQHFLLAAFGSGPNVKNGQYDLYLPGGGFFARGASHHGLVGSPGTATSVITVGAYIFRSSWANNIGSMTEYAAALGDLADYSSPGFRRDGVVKPEITGPASWTLSAMAAKSEMANDLDRSGYYDTVEGGRYLAWEGTSASAPYVTGVIALMLQKNPSLDEASVKKILEDTAIHDDFTGKTPNYRWGYGKINPAAALEATPAGPRT